MLAVYYIFLFALGTFVGSFLNLVSDRLPKGQKIVFTRSKCDFCLKLLGVKNLVPIFSFIMQKGRCSFCGKKLSLYYPVSEIISGLSFILAGYLSNFFAYPVFENLLILIYYIVIFSFFVTMFLTDVKFFLILDVLVIPAIIFVLLYSLLGRGLQLFNLYQKLSSDEFGVYLIKSGYWNNQLIYSLRDFGFILFSAFLISLFFIFLVWITKGRGMGFGDVKLGFLIGLFNGFPLNIVAIFLGFIIGAVYSLLLIAFGKKTMKDTIAFGPFLIIGSLIALLFGANIWEWYTAMGSIGYIFGS